MSGGIGIGGLGSGLDTNAIIQQLVALERLPIEKLSLQQDDERKKLGLISKFKGYVTALQAKAKDLSTEKDFLEFSVSTSRDGVANISVTGSATVGNHTLAVNKLAAIDRWAMNGVTSRTTDLATASGQSLSFDVNSTNYSITLQPDASSLDEIAAEINELAADDVEASVINTGTEGTPSYKLVLTSKTSGEAGRISAITSTVAGLTVNGTGPDGSGVAQSPNNITVGSNAEAVVDGLTITRSTNDFNDVLPGVSITVESTTTASTPINFSIEADKEAITKKVKEFVDSYNQIMSFVNDQNKYDEDGGVGGPLFGDSMLRAVRSAVHGALFNVDLATVAADTEGYSTLSLIGVSTLADGTLLFNPTKFGDKLTANIDALKDLFVDSDGFDNGGALENTPAYYVDTSDDSGLADKLARSIDRLLVSSTGPGGTVLKGLFASKTETLNKKIASYQKQIDSKQFYLEQYQTSLTLRFAKLEEIMGGLNAQGAALQASLAGLI